MILYLFIHTLFFLIEITKQISILSIFRKGVEREQALADFVQQSIFHSVS